MECKFHKNPKFKAQIGEILIIDISNFLIRKLKIIYLGQSYTNLNKLRDQCEVAHQKVVQNQREEVSHEKAQKVACRRFTHKNLLKDDEIYNNMNR